MTEHGSSEDSRIRTIAVATDFSATASAGVDCACALAEEHGARLVLIHVMSLHAYPVGGPRLLVIPPDFEGRVREASLKALEELQETASSWGIEVHAELADGPVVETILEVAGREAADLIVLGTRGITGFEHLLLGSTAESVVRRADFPVLTIHPADEAPLRDVKTVLVPTDFSRDAEHACARLGALLAGRSESLRIVLLHVYSIPAELMPPLGSFPVTAVLAADAGDLAHEALGPVAEKLRARGFTVEIMGREGEAATVVIQVAESIGADLIAMGARGHSRAREIFLGSTAHRVVQHGPCPVLTVRQSDRDG
jgi:nucleotide-binding universal stress UspA family protein